jgi:hypothetical protein
MSFKDWVARNELDKPVWKREKPFGAPSRIEPCKMKHRVGLPLADGSECAIDASNQVITITASGGDIWELDKAKVTNVERLTEKEVQVNLKHRPGMALLGGVTLGIIGAVAGGAMTKEKRSTVTTQFLCLTYIKDDGNLGTLLFQYDDYQTWHDKWRPKMMVKDFQKHRDSYAAGSRHTL